MSKIGQLQSLVRPAKLPFKRLVRIPNLPIAYVRIMEPGAYRDRRGS